MSKRMIAIGFILVSIVLQGYAPDTAGANGIEAPAALRHWLERQASQWEENPGLRTALVRFYEARQFQPAWMGPNGLELQGRILLKTINTASNAKLPEDKAYVKYLKAILHNGPQFTSVFNDLSLESLLQAELNMSRIALDLAFERSIGMGKHRRLLVDRLSEALSEPLWGALLDASQPQQRPYRELKKALERYETIELLGGWPHIPEGSNLRQGKRDPRVPTLRKRLVICGDLGLEHLSVDETYDAYLVDAMRRFQNRHGLKADGIVGPKTLVELNTSVQRRIGQIKLNMARWRRMPESLGNRYILVNIPGYTLKVVENHRVVHSMRAIVGKENRQTPVMSAKMTYLEINPYWNIPQKIARQDLLPKIHKDPLYLVRQKIQVFESWQNNATALDPMTIDWQQYSDAYFPFRLRQEPAVTNALGQIKFMFPNRHAIYIHDTPSKSLFNKIDRSFSSGCVRIEWPLKLAEHLVAEQYWNGKRLRKLLKERKRKVVMLKDPIEVHLVYLTALADERGAVHFFKDLYGHDQQLLAELTRNERYVGDDAVDQLSFGSKLEKASTPATQSSDQRSGDKFNFRDKNNSQAGKSKV
jgi:murein L,D-transpeptidase YcbB/YkuD